MSKRIIDIHEFLEYLNTDEISINQLFNINEYPSDKNYQKLLTDTYLSLGNIKKYSKSVEKSCQSDMLSDAIDYSKELVDYTENIDSYMTEISQYVDTIKDRYNELKNLFVHIITSNEIDFPKHSNMTDSVYLSLLRVSEIKKLDLD